MKKNNSNKYALYLLTIFLLLSVIISGCSKSNPDYDSLAMCLTEKGATMYGTEWCSHCNNQKKMFGSSFDYIIFVDCDKNSAQCDAANVEGYPTWNINGTNYPGEQSAQKLALISGCKLNVSSATK